MTPALSRRSTVRMKGVAAGWLRVGRLAVVGHGTATTDTDTDTDA